MFPHTVTVYNVTNEESPETGFKPKTINYITVLKGVLLDEAKASNVNKSGLEGADAANLYIPLSAAATDGITGKEKIYMGPVEFWRAEDKSALWTLSTGGNCYFVKGKAVHPEWTVQTLEAAYDNVYDVTKIDLKDFGGDMAHFEVGGN